MLGQVVVSKSVDLLNPPKRIKNNQQIKTASFPLIPFLWLVDLSSYVCLSPRLLCVCLVLFVSMRAHNKRPTLLHLVCAAVLFSLLVFAIQSSLFTGCSHFLTLSTINYACFISRNRCYSSPFYPESPLLLSLPLLLIVRNV